MTLISPLGMSYGGWWQNKIWIMEVECLNCETWWRYELWVAPHDARLLFSESILNTSVPRYFLKVSWTGLSNSIGKLTPFWLSEQKAKRTKVKVSLKSSPLSLSKWEMYVECNSSIWRMGWIAWVQSATVVFVCYRPWFFFFLFVISCYSWKL